MPGDDGPHIGWCARQRRGVRLVDGSDRLERAHRKKSRDSIVALRAVVESGVGTWAASASYYAKYHAVYALFMKVGIRCEMHGCTVAAFRAAFDDPALEGLAGDLAASRGAGTAAQRYDMEYDLGKGAGQRLVDGTCRFVAAVDAFADGLGGPGVGEVRARLRELMG